MTFIAEFEEALVVLPALVPLDAILPGGVGRLAEDRPSLHGALERDDLKGALEESGDWFDEDPSSLPAALCRIVLLAKVERDEDARSALHAARDRHPGALALDLVEVDLALEVDEVETAGERLEAVFSDLRSREPDEPGVWRFAGDLFLDLEGEARGLECYQRALEAGTEDYETVFRLAELQRERENWAAAGEAFDRAAELSEGTVGPRASAAECWKEAGELERALEARATLLEHRSGDAEVWARQGIGYREIGAYEKAADALERATRLAPDRTLFWIELAHLHRRRGRLEEAIRGYREVVDEEGPLIGALIGLTSAVLEQGDLDRAERTARRAVDVDGDDPRAHRLLARTLAERGETEGAIEVADRALELDPEARDVRRMRATLAVDAGEETEGLERLERLLEEAPRDPDAAYDYAGAMLRAGRYAQLREFARSHEAAGDWALIAGVFELLGASLDDGCSQDRSAVRADFAEAVRSASAEVPVERDLGEYRRYAMVLEGTAGRLLEQMLDVLEGHRELDSMMDEPAGDEREPDGSEVREET